MSPTIAIPLERRPDERRVALIPPLAARVLERGARLRVQSGAARSAGFHDAAWRMPGVVVVEGFAATVTGADVVLKLAPPTLEEVALLAPGTMLIAPMSAFQHLEEVEALCARGVTTVDMDLVPRRTRARSMNALASQATVAGYKAALLAAELSPRLFPMLTTAAGTVRPALVVVIGAGVAGLQAIATVRRLGARCEAYDIRRAARERIESLGANMIDTGVIAEGPDGLARALRGDERQRQHDVLGEHLARAHAVICAASIPGRPAPRIVTRDLVERMQPDTVLVDMAAATGGNCELTRPGERIEHHDVTIVGPLNLPSHGAVDASEMYARNVVNLLDLLWRDGDVRADPDDEIVSPMVLTHGGAIRHAPTAELLGVPAVPFGTVSRPGSSAAPRATGSPRSGPVAGAAPQDAIADEHDGWLPERAEAAPAPPSGVAADPVERNASPPASPTSTGPFSRPW